MTRAYEGIIDFIAGGSSPDEVAQLQPSEQARNRVAELLARQTTPTHAPEESAELEHYLELEHLMRLAKARARQRLGHE